MNHVLEDILSYLGCSEWDEEDIMHYGMPRRSGRYPYGSGENPYQHSRDFLGRIEELKKNGWEETPENIMKEFGLSTTKYRIEKKICKDERRLDMVATAKSLKADGLGATEIARKMGLPNESSVRSLLNADSESRMMAARNTANFIKGEVDKYGMVDVGTSAEIDLNVSKEMLNTALYLLERDGYPIYKGGIPQVTNPGQQTNQRVICKPGTEHKEIYQYEKVHLLNEDKMISRDGGNTFEKKWTYPESLDSKRLQICYKEDGGIEKDGVIELRRNVPDLDLGESRYSQVRIMVDGTHYLKGMAVYRDDMPDGVDVIFNTNKSKDVAKMDVLKKIKNDPDNPFGSLIKDADQGGQYWYNDPKTGKKKLGLINKRADEGDWDDWSDALPSQFLSKQSIALATKQLNLAKQTKLAEYDAICALENPTLKKHFLDKFSKECDSAAADLKAAALPGQKYHVILPINDLKENEVFAPGYEPGTKLALIRYPHGGTFEIPIVTVTHKNETGKKMIGLDSIDAIGINSKVAERLSGADFDGDTVMCIPTHDPKGKIKIKSTDPLKGLEGFDPKIEYAERPGMQYLKKGNVGTEMGKISNLICDMTLAGAPPEDLAKAVRHSMVVIDAEKHKLDYKRSEKENGIAALNKKWRKIVNEDGEEDWGRGASTIISRAKGQTSIAKTQGTPKINIKGKEWYDPSRPEGALIYKKADDLYYPVRKPGKNPNEVTYTTVDGKKITYRTDDPEAVAKYAPVKNVTLKNGKKVYGSTITNADGTISYKVDYKKEKSTRMAQTDDAMSLVSYSKHPMEIKYAEYANYMKDLANRSRIEMEGTGKIAYDANAKRKYQSEVDSLMKKLAIAESNRPKERAANRLANAEVNKKIKEAEEAGNPYSNGDIKKLKQKALTKYREEVGSISRRERNIDITENEWKAIQAGAISEAKLKKILDNTDITKLREYATPKTTKQLSSAQIGRIKALSKSNYSLGEIAKKMGVSTSTVSSYLKGES